MLFSDALQLGWSDLKQVWLLPGRARFFGRPLTMGGIAIVGRMLLDLDWHHAFLLGSILSPTDPVFAAAIMGRKEIPAPLRDLLNVESGLIDGLALPAVIVLMDLISDAPLPIYELLRQTIGGLAIGIGIGAIAGRLRALRIFDVSCGAAPLHALSAMLITCAAAIVLQVHWYLAAFGAGVSLASVCATAAEDLAARRPTICRPHPLVIRQPHDSP